MRFFTVQKNNFISKTVLLNVWYSLQKNKSKYKEIKPDLSKIKSVKNIKHPISIEELKELTPNYINVSLSEINNERDRLMENPEYNFRGKYYEEFLYKLLDSVITDSNKPKVLFSKRRKVNLNIGKDNIISLLSQYADIPICLIEYLSKRIKINNLESKIATR